MAARTKTKIEDYAPKKVFDKNAKTVRELCPIWGVQPQRMTVIAGEFTEAGEWERVWRKDRFGRPIPAYRPKKQ